MRTALTLVLGCCYSSSMGIQFQAVYERWYHIVWVLAPACFLVFVSGCAGLKSRYAMDNDTYAEKYAEGAERTDVLGKLKQASDARWVEGQDGAYFSGGVLSAPETDEWLGTLSAGREVYPFHWLSTRVGLQGMASSRDLLFAGVELGIRAQIPSRLAPFAGVGVSGGYSAADLFVESLSDEEDTEKRGFAAVYPELGAHFWLNGHLRFTTFARYMITSQGNEHFGWLIGGQLAGF